MTGLIAVLLASLVAIGGVSGAGLTIVHAQSAGVLVNEVELNPKGKDSGSQWVELYNPTSSKIAIGGYKISSSFKGTTVAIPAGAVIDAGKFYVLKINDARLSSVATSISLLDGSGKVVDKTPSLVDRHDDSRTWQQVPDGGSEWKFKDQTKSKANDPSSKGSSSSSSSSSTSPQSSKCSGSGMCLEGKVSKVTDSDTVYVKVGKDVYKVDLSLTKALAKKDVNYSKATLYTQALCLGNSAVVDQDDKQKASGKNLKGVVYCSGQNLNSELLDNKFVSLDKNQCAKSEFSTTSWARKNGC